jgi:hypothetical protein
MTQRQARRAAFAAVEATVERADLELHFGLFEDPGMLTEPGGTVRPEKRPAWAAVFRGVERKRASGIPEPRRPNDSVPPTTSRVVMTDVLVIIDDRSGRVLIRSEFAAEARLTD